MNAVRYQKLMNYPWEGVVSLLFLFLFGCTFTARVVRLHGSTLTGREMVAWAIVVIFALVIFAQIPVLLLRKWLARHHPEMAYLDDWVQVRGSACGYPTSDDEKLEASWSSGVQLNDRARLADFSFTVRDDMRRRAKGFFKGTPERAAADGILALLERFADGTNAEYLALWDLDVKKLEILTGPQWADPNKHREDLRVAE